MSRECGILMPIFSLPSKYGIGSFSKEAYQFIDLLKAAGQQYWQILPLGPTGYGDSPYQSFSAFAGNPYFIDLESLTAEGLLTQEECGAMDFGSDSRDIDYQKLYENRLVLLKTGFDRWIEQVGMARAEDLIAQNLQAETREYCFYMAVKNVFHGSSWIFWDEDIKFRKKKTIEKYRSELWREILFYEFQQLKFQEQWHRLKQYAHKQNIFIIGDIPIYVALDSVESWSHPELFQFDKALLPTAVSGCPPDGFSADGQLWGNPLYRWEYHQETGYEWWMKRMEYCFRQYDLVRLDHFRGFDEYYSIPYGKSPSKANGGRCYGKSPSKEVSRQCYESVSAEHGHWEPGPGIEIFNHMKRWFQMDQLPVIAEDLGFLTPTVIDLVKETGFPGMKVLEFAFDSREESDYLPHNYQYNSVVYTGTHDNDTLRGWYEKMGSADRAFAIEYLGNEKTEISQIHWDFIRMALASVSKLVIIPCQDYLGLGSNARINEPSTIGKNWRWRMHSSDFDVALVKRCRRMAEIYGRFKMPANSEM